MPMLSREMLFAACPVCGHRTDKDEQPNEISVCQATADQVPLRCPHAADAEQHRLWHGETYHAADGQRYRVVVKREGHPNAGISSLPLPRRPGAP